MATTSESQPAKKEPGWFEVEDDFNPHVYVSNLPLDTTEEEFITLMKKYGLLMKDPETGKFKIKMYTDKEGKFKGDALCSYIKVESVELALQLLDGDTFKNNVITCERAQFQLKGDYDPKRKPKMQNKMKKKLKKKVDRLFDWRPEKLPGERAHREKTVVIKNLFDPKEFDETPEAIFEYKEDVMEECSNKCGPVKKIQLFDKHPEGVVSVTFEDHDAADKCIELMEGRWYAKRKLSASHWDGRTKYKKEEQLLEEPE